MTRLRAEHALERENKAALRRITNKKQPSYLVGCVTVAVSRRRFAISGWEIESVFSLITNQIQGDGIEYSNDS
jgi:hypothetical protein